LQSPMKIKDIMQKRVVTVDMDCSLWEVKMIFDNTRFHHLLVIEKDRLVGVISDRDYLKAASPNLGTAAETTKDTATLNKRAHQIMSRKLHTLDEDATVLDAILLFNQKPVSCIPVVDDERHIKGILSWRDIMKVMYDKMTN